MRGVRGAWPTRMRHAIELRISAEDPARAFAPTPGRIDSLARAGGPGRAHRLRGGGGDGWSAATTTRCWPSCWSSAPTATAPSRARGAPSREMETGGIQTTLPFHALAAAPSGLRRRATCAPTWSTGTGTRRRCARPPPGAPSSRSRGRASGADPRRRQRRRRPGRPGAGVGATGSAIGPDGRRRLDPDGSPGSDGALAVTDDALLRLTALGVDDDLVVELAPGRPAGGDGRLPRASGRCRRTAERPRRRAHPVRGHGRRLGHRGDRGVGGAGGAARARHAARGGDGPRRPAGRQGPDPRAGRPGLGRGRRDGQRASGCWPSRR